MRKSARKRSRPSLLPRQKRERRRTEYLGLVGIICFATVISGAFFVSDAAKYALRNKNVAAVVSAVLIDLANQDRAQNALPSLALNPTLTAAAQAKANDMAEKGYQRTRPHRKPW